VRAAAPGPCPLEPGARVGGYEIEAELACGESGWLHRARRGRRHFAVRMARRRLSDLAPAEQKRERERMGREFPVLRSLRHPNLVRVRSLEWWPDPAGHPCLVTDPWEGESLRDWCARRRPTWSAIAPVFEAIARAVGHMHRRGLVHRDLRREGIVVREGGEPLLVEFALPGFGPPGARGSRRRAPECAGARKLEALGQGELFGRRPAADLYALGYMLYEALTGEPPDGGGPARGRIPGPPSERGAPVPGALDELVLRLLERDPGRRPASAAEVARTLARLGAPAGAPPASSADPPERGDGRPVAPPLPEGGFARTTTVTGSGGRGAVGGAEPAAPAPRPFDPPTLRSAPPFDAGTEGHRPAPVAEASPEEIPAAIREVKARLAAAAPRRPLTPLAVAAGAVGLSVAGALVALAASGSRAAERPAPWGGGPAGDDAYPPAAFPAAPPPTAAGERGPGPRDEAQAIDEEVEREFGRPTVMPDGGIESARSSPEPKGAPAATADASPWLVRSHRRGPEAAAGEPKARGVPLGLHLRARLLTNLDSRTIGNGPVEAVLPRPAQARGGVVLPEGTLAFGSAGESNGRFTIRFTRLRLPDETEVSFDGLALAREDGKPGLPASLKIESAVERGPGGVVEAAKEPAGLLLDSVASGPVPGLARRAGEKAFERGPSAATGAGRALLLDAGVLFDIFVERSF